MQPKNQRLAWIVIVVLLLVVVGAVGFGLGVAAAHGGVADGMPLRGFGVRYPGVGLLGLLAPLVLVGLAVALLVLLFREPGDGLPRRQLRRDRPPAAAWTCSATS